MKGGLTKNVIAANDSAPSMQGREASYRAKAATAGEDRSTQEMIVRFVALAERLDAAGFGPADYLYTPLKWRLQHPDISRTSFLASVLKAWRLVLDPPPVPRGLEHAAILAASSYAVSARFLRQVVDSFEPGEAVLCDVSATAPRSLSRRIVDSLGLLAAAGPALIFALRVNAALRRARIGPVERRRIAEAAFIHAAHRRGARAILQSVRPECLVIANGNRAFELSLFAEAKARGIATVLLPFAEINPKPARFLSLCRGAFDLVLPFSEHSAAEIRKLRQGVAVEVVGFPVGSFAIDMDETSEPGRMGGFKVLYICGNNFEDEASVFLRTAFADIRDVKLRVRLHPRNTEAEIRALFSWVAQDRFSNPLKTPLAEDIGSADAAIMVRSTVALDAMFAGVPMIWLSPSKHRAELESHPVRKQELALLDAATPEELRGILQKLAHDEGERQRVRDEQWARLRAAGYNQDYFDTVRTALRRLLGRIVGIRQPEGAAAAPLRP
jgi:hypothetical protein